VGPNKCVDDSNIQIIILDWNRPENPICKILRWRRRSSRRRRVYNGL
jgi:hypothetical protein